MSNSQNISHVNSHYQVVRKVIAGDSIFINKRIAKIKSMFLCKICIQKYHENILKSQYLLQCNCPDFEIILYPNKDHFTTFQKEMLKICMYFWGISIYRTFFFILTDKDATIPKITSKEESKTGDSHAFIFVILDSITTCLCLWKIQYQFFEHFPAKNQRFV